MSVVSGIDTKLLNDMSLAQLHDLNLLEEKLNIKDFYQWYYNTTIEFHSFIFSNNVFF